MREAAVQEAVGDELPRLESPHRDVGSEVRRCPERPEREVQHELQPRAELDEVRERRRDDQGEGGGRDAHRGDERT